MDARGELTAHDVHNVAFSKPPYGERGYNEDEVDEFLEHVERRLADTSATTPTAADIAAISFSKPPIGKRGYAEDEVDGFLERVAQQLAKTDGDAAQPSPARDVAQPQHYEAPPLDAPPSRKWWQLW